VGLTLVTSRTTFAGLSSWERALWYALALGSVVVFAWGIWRLMRKYRAGRGPVGGGAEPVGSRLRRTTRIVLTHAWIRRRAGASGTAHLVVFYGFLVLFAGTAILAFQDDFAKPLLGWTFWRGAFYEGYSLFLDVFGAGLVIGLTILGVRRAAGRVRRIHYDVAPPREAHRYVLGDWAFIGSLYLIALTGFLLEALRIAVAPPPFEVWSPVGWVVGHGLRDLGLTGSSAQSAHFAVWWLHGLTAITFVAAIPFTKGLHMLGGPVGVAVRSERPGVRLAELPAGVAAADVGYQRISHLTPAHLIDLDACTRCGKCDEVCPARQGGWPLAPRSLVLDLREAADRALGVRAGSLSLDTPLVPDVLSADTIWSCTQCMACVEICPVGIEHVPIINGLRRGLVERGEMDTQLQKTLEAVQTSGNSFGESRRKRARWAKALDFELKDAREDEVDLLWFVGDSASFDPRNQENTRALAQLLHLADADVGVLFEAEQTAGNDVRRVGEEFLFRSLAEQNIELISGCSFDRILTSDPHTFNTLRNEYPPLGAGWRPEQVVHHSQLLLELLESGSLRPVRSLGRRATYHDPCTLGRYNGIYEEPRRVLTRIGLELVEMPRNRDNSFCCGAGGGRIWMTTPKPAEGARKPAEQRIDEAVALPSVEHFVVACPKDVTMYEDGIKTAGHSDAINLRELSQLVFEACAPEPQPAPEDAREWTAEAPADGHVDGDAPA
jgi:Fe-S oxidoreductase